MADTAEARRARQARRTVGENGRPYADDCPADKHGAWGGFGYWCCECDTCLAARSAANREARRRRAHNLAVIASLEQARETAPPEQSPPEPEGPGLDDEAQQRIAAITKAYHEPDIVWVGQDGNERRIGGGVRLVVKDGAVIWVGDHESADGAPRILRDRPPTRHPKRGRGPSGSRNPTSWRELRERLTELGCRIERGGAHDKVYLPNGKVSTLAISASDHRSLLNTVSELRSLGVDVRRPA